jgi:hypothetical protein
MKLHFHPALATLCAVACAASTPALAKRITLNDTSVAQCSRDLKEWSSECTRSHQDAAYGRDVSFPDAGDGVAGFSFRKVCRSGEMAGEGSCPVDPALGSSPDNWGCVYDSVTQLTWEAKTVDGGMHDDFRRFTNRGHRARFDPADAAWLVDATNVEGLCGATNWRLPHVLELHSIVAYGMATPGHQGPLIDHVFFPNTYTKRLTWSDAQSFYRGWRWFVDFTDARIGYAGPSVLGSARLVHPPVHAERLSPLNLAMAKDRFVPSLDGTEVTDTVTGLIWQRCTVGMAWNNESQSCDGAATIFTQWTDVLDYAKTSRAGGWRLPNVKELFSIVDVQAQDPPVIDHVAFPNTPIWAFVSSTPMKFDGGISVGYVEFGGGSSYTLAGANYTTFHLRLVRRGRE